MKIQSVKDDAFKPYGRIVDGYDYKLLLERLESETEKPADGVIYEPTCEALEDTPAFAQLRDNCYGGMPIEIGYCNGTNTISPLMMQFSSLPSFRMLKTE